MKILTDFFLILFALFSVKNLNGQKDLRVGYIDMDYILSNIQDFEVANKEFDYKIEQWKNEIFEREKKIKTKREELEFEKDLIPNQIYIKRSKELDFDYQELENYKKNRSNNRIRK